MRYSEIEVQPSNCACTPLPTKTSQGISTATRSEGASVPNQQVQDSAKLFQVDSSPSPTPVNDKRKKTEKEITVRKLRELKTEINELRIKTAKEKAAEAEATAGTKENLPAIKKNDVYIQGPIADKQGLAERWYPKRRKQNILKREATKAKTIAGTKEESTELSTSESNKAKITVSNTLPIPSGKTYGSETTQLDDQQADKPKEITSRMCSKR
ncbi:MAG: hypothetical protein Q9226_009118 [Calogaya cf. arnoldii]